MQTSPYFITRFLCSPLEAMYTLLVFIVCVELKASPLPLTILTCMKPLVSFFGFYASTFVVGKAHQMKKYLIIMNLMGCLPCFFFPFVDNVWFFVFSYGLFMTALRASFPVWNEVLKRNIGLSDMKQTVSIGSAINFGMTIFVPLLFSFWMDQQPNIWKLLFFGLGIFQALNTLGLLFLKIAPGTTDTNFSSKSLLEPWKKGWSLLRNDIQFTKYQVLFFLGGVGLVVMMPTLPLFFKDTLHLSYTQLTLGFSLCKGIGFVLSSFSWLVASRRYSLYIINALVNILSCIFIACLFAAPLGLPWLYVGYLAYGTMQSGCELSLNLSGPFFSKEKESTFYSSVNLAVIGIRGVICPFLGQFLLAFTGIPGVFIFAAIMCALGIIYAFMLEKASKANLLWSS